MPSMLMSVAFVVCQVRVVDWPWLMVFGFADSEAVGAAAGGGGGGGGGATFLWHAPKNIMRPSATTRVDHFLIEIVIFIACFTDSSSFPCARVVACNVQIRGRAHSGPAAKPCFFSFS
jgi:hypothetical protein